MIFALSTHWNAGRHASGETMIEEIASLGFTHVELGYDLRMDLVPGVQKMVQNGTIRVNSLHNFCPVPVGASRGHPEIFTLSSVDSRERQSAVQHTTRTIRFAAEVGARAVVTHGGNVDMESLSKQLCELAIGGQQYSPLYEKIKLKCQMQRDKKVNRQLQYLRESIDQLLPVLEETKIKLCFENLPTWEAIPTEIEIETILKQYNSPWLGYWHDIGHGQIRENLGFINHERWLDRLQTRVVGMHVHDVARPVTDHVMPPHGTIDFSRFKRFGTLDIIRVIEPSTRTPKEEVIEGHAYLKNCWNPEPVSTEKERQT